MTIWMLELGREFWRLHSARDEGPLVVAEHALNERELVGSSQAIHESLTTHCYQGEAIVLALDSNWCVATTLVLDRLQDLRDRQTMMYRLEEWIPWGAEECVSDYAAVGNQALAVAAPSVPLADWIGRLETHGVAIQSIVPTALLAAAEHLAEGDWPADHVVALATDGHVDLIEIQDSRPIRWSWCPTLARAIARELTHFAIAGRGTAKVVAYGLESDVVQPLRGDFELTEPPVATRTTLAFQAATKLLVGKLDVPVDLKRGPFGARRGNRAVRRHAMALQIAASVLLCTLAGALVFRGHSATRRADEIAAEQTAIFRCVFPNTKVPVGIKTRLDSELAKLKGLQGDEPGLPGGISATEVLYRLLSAAPEEQRFRLLEIRIEEGTLYLDGEVRVHGDAEVFAQRLRAQGFEVAPPRTQRLDDQRVSLRITGQAAATEEKGRKTL